jgi:hypothetical protein
MASPTTIWTAVSTALASACAKNEMLQRPLSKRKRRAIITTSGVVTAQR